MPRSPGAVRVRVLSRYSCDTTEKAVRSARTRRCPYAAAESWEKAKVIKAVWLDIRPD